ncbi:MAG TPA: PKD domain-containing protein [Chitinophagales bacterium]|nr:PKD domain-containing protein [Chitinophagales bacterium]
MKPHIILSLLAAVSCWFSSVHAQEVQNSSPAIGVSPLQSESRSGVLELMAQPEQSSSTRTGLEFIPIGTAYNLYTTLNNSPSQVACLPELNTVVFIHRHNAGTTGGSGGLSFDSSTDGGATWTINQSLTPSYNAGAEPEVIGGRYPSITLWNPPGNTLTDNVFVLAHGPELDPAAGGSWGSSFHISTAMDMDYLNETYYSTDDAHEDYLTGGLMTYNDGSIWDLKTFVPGNHFSTVKHVFHPPSKTFIRNEHVFEPDWYVSDGELVVANGEGETSFDPTGTIGYAVLLGCLSDDVVKTMAPVIYKTTDAGATWNQLPSFDWTAMPLMEEWMFATVDAGEYIPYFEQVSATVDVTGRLHIFSEVFSRYTSNYADSIMFIYSNSNVFLHLSTSDGTDWQGEALGYTTLDKAFIGSAEIQNQTQISRTPDGSKLFFCWNVSDSLMAYVNDRPNIYVKGYDVVSNTFTETVNLTMGTAFVFDGFFPTTAGVTLDNGFGEYELPIVFAVPGATDLSPPQFYYIDGVTFTDADFVPAEPATAAFTYFVDGPTVLFNNNSLFADTYAWDFGDGYSSTIEDPVHTYADPGVYNVCLTASNDLSTDEFCQDVTVVLDCEPPSPLVVLLVSSNQIRLGWSEVPGADYYQVQYRQAGTAAWSKKTTITLNVKLTGLTPGTTYEYRARSNCAGSFSSYSPIESVATTMRLGSTDPADPAIYPNPTTGSFYIQTPQSSGSELTVRVVDMAGSVVFEQVCDGSEEEILVETGLPSGMYLVQLRSAQSCQEIRLIIQ